MYGLAVYVKEGLPFARDLSLENSSDSYFCFQLALLHSLSYLLLFCWSLSLSLCTVFDPISSKIDEVLSINPSANAFIFRDFNIHHKDWLTYSRGTDRSGELCYNFSISRDLTQMVNSSTQVPDCDSDRPDLLDLFLSPDNGFLSIGKFWSCCCFSFHWLSIIFTTGCPVSLHCLWLFSCCLRRSSWSLRDIPWEDIFKLSASTAASEFCEWGQVGIDVYIPHQKYEVKLTHLHGFQLLVLLP